jgi:hypothetical protein
MKLSQVQMVDKEQKLRVVALVKVIMNTSCDYLRIIFVSHIFTRCIPGIVKSFAMTIGQFN